jgi:hypothetical protein
MRITVQRQIFEVSLVTARVILALAGKSPETHTAIARNHSGPDRPLTELDQEIEWATEFYTFPKAVNGG